MTITATNPAASLEDPKDPLVASIINAEESEFGIRLLADGVTFNGFTVTDTETAIYITGVSNCKVTNNYITDNGEGIYCSETSGDTISGNIIEDNATGIEIYDGSAITISDNVIYDIIGETGIEIDDYSVFVKTGFAEALGGTFRSIVFEVGISRSLGQLSLAEQQEESAY